MTRRLAPALLLAAAALPMTGAQKLDRMALRRLTREAG